MKLKKEFIKTEVLKRKHEIIAGVQALVKIKSYTNTDGVKNVINEMEKFGQKENFEIKKYNHPKEGLSMHFHYGSKNDFLGIIGHLDTVPVNQKNWDFDAHSGEIINGYITGRGAQDDKGPTFAAFYATKIIKDLKLPISKGIRIIFGTQEEGGNWSDINYYFSQEPIPKVAFTPDAFFPLIFAEKGIVRIEIRGIVKHKKPFSFQGGKTINAVADYAKAKIDGKTFEYKGTAFHGAYVHETDLDSAIFKGLDDIKDKVDSKLVNHIIKYFCNDPYGKNVGIAYDTELEGPLTLNFSVLNIEENGNYSLKIDIRFPKSKNQSHKSIEAKILNNMKEIDPNTSSIILSHSPGIFAHPESRLIKTLETAYRNFTGETKEISPLQTTGGGTYARVIENCVAFGGIFPHDENTMHQANERFKIDSLLKTVMIYVEAIYELVK